MLELDVPLQIKLDTETLSALVADEGLLLLLGHGTKRGIDLNKRCVEWDLNHCFLQVDLIDLLLLWCINWQINFRCFLIFLSIIIPLSGKAWLLYRGTVPLHKEVMLRVSHYTECQVSTHFHR